jgi:hypothetical protein
LWEEILVTYITEVLHGVLYPKAHSN